MPKGTNRNAIQQIYVVCCREVTLNPKPLNPKPLNPNPKP